MTEIEIIDVPAVKREVKIDSSTRLKLAYNVQEEAQVVIHCSFTGTLIADRIRIWKTTFLCAHNSSHRSQLVHAENITMYPVWMKLANRKTVTFTLIFSALPKDCVRFDMIEDIPEPGGWVVKNIERNSTDVYLLDLN
jgi:hypothetical protein